MRSARLLLAAAARAAAATDAPALASRAATSSPAALPWRRLASYSPSDAPSPSAAAAAAAASAAAAAATSSTLVWPPPPEAFREGGALDGLRTALTGDGESESVSRRATTPARPPPISSTRLAGQAGRASPVRPAPLAPARSAARPYARIMAASEVASILAAAACDDVTLVDGLDAGSGCTFTEAMVFGTARSTRHAAMAAEAVVHELKQRIAAAAAAASAAGGDNPLPALSPVVEGDPGADAWLLVDAGSVIAHVFVGADVRAAYDVESLWRGGGGGGGGGRVEDGEGGGAGPGLER